MRILEKVMLKAQKKVTNIFLMHSRGSEGRIKRENFEKYY